MAKVSVTKSKLDSLANAVAAKSGESVPLTVDEMTTAVLSIDTDIEMQSKTITPTESSQTVTADNGYDGLLSVQVGAISSTYIGSEIVQRSSTDLSASGDTVTVPNGYYENEAMKAVASGTAGTPTASKGTVSNNSVTVTPSVTNTTGYITGGTKIGTGISVSASELVSGTYNVISSGTKDVTNYASISVPSGSEGTPTATKGTVNNHAISVTPSVTNTGGYITGSAKTGTAVSISASELVSGTYNVSASGTADVTNYENISVPSGTAGTPTATKGTASNGSISVTPSVTNTTGFIIGGTISGTAVTVTANELDSGTKTITENDTGIDVVGYATVDVNVSGSNNGYTRTVVCPQQTVTPASNGTYYGATLNVSEGFEADAEYIITFNGTEYFFTCQVLWGTNYLLGDINYFYGSSGLPYPFGIIWTSGTTCTIARDNGNQVAVKIEKLELTGSGGGGGSATLITKTITANGTYNASSDSADGYSEVTVNVTPNLQSKSATPTTSTQTISPDNGYDGLSSVTVGAIPSQYIVPTGNKAITENGTDIDVAEYATVSVNVPSSGVSITDGIVVTARDSNGYATAIDFYGTVVQPYQFYNRTTSSGGWINLSTISFKSGVVNEIKSNGFIACGNLTTIDLSSVETIGNSAFQECKSLSLVTVPELTSISNQGFLGCTSLQTFVAPKLRSYAQRTLRQCSALTTVQLGSIGYGVTSIANTLFEQDTQTGLTITVYTKGSYVDTAVTNVRKGATNATIVIKASEATTYSGTSYAAGDTIVTSTP